jgi:hypothetical protein
LAKSAAFAPIGVVGFDGQIELEALRPYALPEDATASLRGTPTLAVGQREFVAAMAWDPPSLDPGARQLADVTATGCRQRALVPAALASSTHFIELDAFAWTTNTVRVMARNISPSATFDLASAMLSSQGTKRRIP